MKKFTSVLMVLSAFLLMGCGEKKTETEISSAKGNETKEKKIGTVVVFGGSYWTLENDSLVFYDNVIPGTVLDPIIVNEKTDIQFLSSDGGLKKSHVHVTMDDQDVWVEERYAVQNSTAAVTMEAGTEIYLYESPDVDSKKIIKLPSEIILALVEKCQPTKEFPEASKFSKVKVPDENEGKYMEGFVRNSNIDSSMAQVALVQVRTRYNQLVKSGNVASDVLHEMEDTMEDLRSWNGR